MTRCGDDHVRDAVIARLTRTSGAHTARIGVAVDGGVVTLSGQVENFAEKDRVRDAALEVPGAWVVVDHIVVQDNLGRFDEPDLARQVVDIVSRAASDVGAAVKAAVHRGEVTLTGTVVSTFDHDALVDAVADLDSVSRVLDNVGIDPAAAASDIKQAITSRLVHNAQLDSNHITVEVCDGVVTLAGTVRSADELRQAERVARDAPRIRQVRNLLRIGR